jgi:hypothetical protein
MELIIGSPSNPANILKFSPNTDLINLNTPDTNLSSLLTQMTGNTNYPNKFALLESDDYLSDLNTDSIILGNQGNDQIFGNGGNDLIHGGLGTDILNGGEGNDRLAGEQNNDTLTGGNGSDQFIWGHSNDGNDIITDFADGIDKISLKNGLSWNSLKLSQIGANVVITTVPGSISNISLTLQNFNLSNLDVSDFVISGNTQGFYNVNNTSQWLASSLYQNLPTNTLITNSSFIMGDGVYENYYTNHVINTLSPPINQSNPSNNSIYLGNNLASENLIYSSSLFPNSQLLPLSINLDNLSSDKYNITYME